MAAMAPALTDAPAEAHRIRFKLAPPSSTLSPSGVEGNGGTSHILVSSNGTVKRKASEERPARGAGTCKREEPARGDTPQAHLGKIQPLVTSYRCSDVMSVHSPKESLKFQGVLLQNHGILPGYLPRKHQALEEQFKSIMSGGSGSGMCGSPALQGTPVNGMAKKLAKPGPDNRDNTVTLNGGGRRAGQNGPAQTHIVTSYGALMGNGPLRGGADHQCPRDVSQDHPSNPESPSPSPPPNAPSDLDEDKVSDRLPSLTTDTSLTSPAMSQYPLGGLGTELRDRTQQTQSRQSEIEGRLQRLRKRLQVVQAKQVERHVQQQLGGLLRSTLAPLDALRQQQGRQSTEPLTPQERDRLNRVLKVGSVPAELERLSISGSTNLRSAEGAFDSDATESSSGGETDVEEDELTRVDMEQRHIPLWRRAEGRFAVDRASIISHWNWLQAHVSDLEYRIRQQTDIYRQIKANKGPVLLGESSVCELLGEDSGVSRTDSITWPASQGLGGGGDWAKGSVSAHGIALEMNLRKGYPPVRQVNGVINSLRASSPESTELEQQLTPQQQGPGSSPDSTCVAARTRPVLSCKRRRLLRPNSVTNLNRRVRKLSGPGWCGCEVSRQCVMCCGRSLGPLDPQFHLPLLDRLSQFDPCIHPILSFPDDVGISLHLQRLLKCHWQGRPLEKIKPIKMSLKHKLPLSSRLPDPSSSSSSKDKHKLTNSLLSTVRLSHHKSRPEKLLRQQSEGSESRQLFRPERSHATFDKSHSRKRPHEHSLERTENAPKLFMEMSSSCPSLPSLNTPSHSPLVRQLSSSECPTPPCSLNNATPQPIRRRRGESSFDINNIVIPMSVAATTRVEKLQYKEILTPRWREVDVTARKISKEDNLAEVEDLSEAVFTQLHLPYEEQERSRWSWTASAIAKRRGSRSYKSVDGRTTPLLGCTNPSTPQPSSPDTAHFHLLQDYSSAASPSSPVSPEMLMFSGPHTPGPRDSHRLLSNEDTRCSTPDTIYEEMVSQPVQPWERRTFPLDVDPVLEYEDQISSASEQPCRTVRRISGCKTGSSRSESDVGPPSPLPEDISKQKANPPLKHTHR